MLRTITSPNAPKAIGPYSQAVAADNLIFCSGQIGMIPETGELADGLTAQTVQVLKNLQAVLNAGESDLEHVLKTTVFLRNMGDFSEFNQIYETYFSSHKPARATIEVTNLPKGALIEIEAIAITK